MKKLTYLILIFSTPIFATQTIECNFTSVSDNEGHYKIENDYPFKLTFLINNSDKKTYMTKNDASSKTEVVYNKSNLMSIKQVRTFYYINKRSASAHLTTITKKMEAVHSAHSLSVFGSTIKILEFRQYYGLCTNK